MSDDYDYTTYTTDVTRIINVAHHHKILLSESIAIHLWRTYSEQVCAGWLLLPESDNELWSIINRLFHDPNVIEDPGYYAA